MEKCGQVPFLLAVTGGTGVNFLNFKNVHVRCYAEHLCASILTIEALGTSFHQTNMAMIFLFFKSVASRFHSNEQPE